MDKKSQQLGIPYSRATARLKKQVLFKLVIQVGMDTCYRCQKKITNVEDLSFEHKLPWQDVSVALFWDLDNIAFSHKRCNYAAARRVGKVENLKRNHKAINAPADKAWCSTHQDYLPTNEFYTDPKRVSGFNANCKECRKKKYAPVAPIRATNFKLVGCG